MPVYARGREGTIERFCGAFPNPEELAYGFDGLPKRPLYRVRMRQIDALIAQAPKLKVGLVQPNFAYSVDAENTETARAEALRQLTALQSQSRRLEAAGAQFLVWSEGAYPVTLPREFAADFAWRYNR